MRRTLPLLFVLLLVLSTVAFADGAIEVSVMQSALAGEHFAGTIGSLRLCNVVAPEPIGKIDVFADGGVRFAESSVSQLVGGLVGASVGQRDKALRVGFGYQYPGGGVVYVRACIARW